MIPKKELQDLAKALKSTPEYVQMIALRQKLMNDPQSGKRMQNFEREHMRIMHRDFPEDQVASHINNLYHEYKDLLEQDNTKAYMSATQKYQNMVSTCIDYLNGLLDTTH